MGLDTPEYPKEDLNLFCLINIDKMVIVLSPSEIHKINKQLMKENRFNQLIELSESSPYYPFYNFINDLVVSKVYKIDYLYDMRILLFMNYIKTSNDIKYDVKEIKTLYNNQQDEALQNIMDQNNLFKIPTDKKVRMVK